MKRYLAKFFLCLVLIFGSIGLFNFLVDPLLLYRADTAIPDQVSQVEQFFNMRLYKPRHVGRLKPEALIVGTSRSGTISPDSEAWRGLAGYNFSQPGMTLYELFRSVQHAQAQQPLAKLMVGLDFSALAHSTPLFRLGFEEARHARDASDIYSPKYIFQQLTDLRTTLFSFYITGESVQALNPPKNRSRRYYDDGSWESASRGLRGRGGYAFVGRGVVSEARAQGVEIKGNLAVFRDLLQFCYANEIDTRFFFTPAHVFFVDLWFRLGAEQAWYEAHREVVRLNEEVAEKYGRPAFEIWGFGNERNIVTEPIYGASEAGKAWFSDGLHYESKLAVPMKLAVWGEKPGFGTQLSSGTVMPYLKEIDRMRQEFIHSNQEVVTTVYQRIDSEL